MFTRVLFPSRVTLIMTMVVALLGLAVVTAACGGDDDGSPAARGVLPSGQRTIYVTAMEYKGSTEVSKEAFPAQELPGGGGYGLKPSAGDPPKWEVNAYAWAPATIVVAEGDDVTIHFFGTNGAVHASSIEGHVKEFLVYRGQVTTVEFPAGKPGIYTIVCQSHAPNMTGQMVVLPRAQ